MLTKTNHDCGSRLSVARIKFGQGIQVPSVDPENYQIIAGRVLVSTNHRLEHEQLLQSLRSSDRVTLRQLFHTLSPPAMGSLVGEYDGELLDQGGGIGKLLTTRAFGMHGDWIGKAFSPVNEHTGVGYNYFRSGSGVVRNLPMTTTIEASTLDDSSSLMISYKGSNRGLVRWLIGEIRQVTPSVMLGVGIFGPTLGRRDIARRKIPFILVGPRRAFQNSPKRV